MTVVAFGDREVPVTDGKTKYNEIEQNKKNKYNKKTIKRKTLR